MVVADAATVAAGLIHSTGSPRFSVHFQKEHIRQNLGNLDDSKFLPTGHNLRGYCQIPKDGDFDTHTMSYYDEIEIEDMTFDPTLQIYHYPCPCGDRFEIPIGDLRDGEEVAVCPSCSLMIRVIFDVVFILATFGYAR